MYAGGGSWWSSCLILFVEKGVEIEVHLKHITLDIHQLYRFVTMASLPIALTFWASLRKLSCKFDSYP